MRATQRFAGTERRSMTQSLAAPRCVIKCVKRCVIQLHTSTAARPRQHWVFTRDTSPTTRPPHISAEGLVRVVGLVCFLFGCWRERAPLGQLSRYW
jgi:hypothetical protein